MDKEDLELEGLSVRIYEADLNKITRDVIGAAIEVHRNLGAGFSESVYEEALCHELELRNVPFVRQFAFKVKYKGKIVGEGRLDLLIGNQLIVELKSVDELAKVHDVQVLSYLKATGHPLALLINFNVAVLTAGGIKRLIL